MGLALAVLAAGSLRFAGLELELGSGVAHSLETYRSTSYPLVTPTLQGRVAVRVHDRLSLGGSFLAVIGGEARNGVACCGPDSGNQAFTATAALLSLRYHFPGDAPRWWMEGGAGIGHLISLQTDSASEHPPLRGRAGVSGRMAFGLGWEVAQNLRVGGELAGVVWTNVEQAAGGGNGDAPAQSGLWTPALLLLASVGFSIAP
jgi:hypothetical protein